MDRQYARNFITLEQRRGAYAEKGRTAFGSCVIDIKGHSGKISATAQYLKPELTYKLCLIAADEQQALCREIAMFEPGAGSKSECRRTFDTNNVYETGLPIEAFNIIAVSCRPDGGDTVIVLDGAVREAPVQAQDIPWRDKLVFVDTSEPEPADDPVQAAEIGDVSPEVALAQLDEAVETFIADKIIQSGESAATVEAPRRRAPEKTASFHPIFLRGKPAATAAPANEMPAGDTDPKEPVPKEPTEENGAADYHGTFKTMAKKFNDELDELNAYSRLSEAALDDRAVAAEPEIPDDHRTPEERIRIEINRIFDEHPRTMPFGTPEDELSWVVITLDELSALPFYVVGYMNHPFLLSGYYRYKHLILGKNRSEEGRYLLGVPDRYSTTDAVMAASLEFRQFQPCGGERIGEGVYGYWLMIL